MFPTSTCQGMPLFFGPPHVLFVAAEAVGLAVAPTTARRILHLASGDNSSHDRATNQLDSPGMPLKKPTVCSYVYICLHLFTHVYCDVLVFWRF